MINVSAARRGNRSVTELNIAPLIDMVFILLIFFLVTTSFVKETGIDAANRIYIDHREVDVRAVRANVERALAENPEGAVIVVADQASSTGTAIQVMDGCRMAGAHNVSLAARLPE